MRADHCHFQARDNQRPVGDKAEAMVGDIRALRDVGVTDLDFSFDGNTADEVLANMKRLRDDVLAKA